MPPCKTACFNTIRTSIAAMVLCLWCSNLHAQGETTGSEKRPPWYESISVNGFLSTAYSYNLNTPDTMKNKFRVFDFDDNSFKVDVMELSLKKDVAKPGDAGFRFDLTAGSSIPRVARSAGFDIGDLDFHQMYISYIAPVGNGLKLDVGKFITSMGYEVIEGYDGYNDHYSRSFLFGYAIPFTHTGLKASYAFNDRVSAMLMVVNGWDNAVDNNKWKSMCAQLGIIPTHGMNVSVNYMLGPEKPNNNTDNRSTLDVVCTYAVNNRVTLGVNGDYGSEEHSAGSGGRAVWGGVAGYVKANVSGSLSVSLRGEQFKDIDGIRTGISQRLQELTLTPEYHPAEHLVVRGDARIDKSNHNVFQKSGEWTDTQTTLSLNILYIF